MVFERVVTDDSEIENLKRDSKVGRLLWDAAQPVVREAQRRAPHRTGRGAAGIHAEMSMDMMTAVEGAANGGINFAQGAELTAHISWQREEFYMYFHERGTEHMRARPFLVPTLRGLK